MVSYSFVQALRSPFAGGPYRRFLSACCRKEDLPLSVAQSISFRRTGSAIDPLLYLARDCADSRSPPTISLKTCRGACNKMRGPAFSDRWAAVKPHEDPFARTRVFFALINRGSAIKNAQLSLSRLRERRRAMIDGQEHFCSTITNT
jgi:hypothetical protein